MGFILPLLLLSFTLITAYPIPPRSRRDVVQFTTSADALDGSLVIPYSNIVIPNGLDDREKRGCPCGCGCPNCRCCCSGRNGGGGGRPCCNGGGASGGCSCNGGEEGVCPCGCGRKGCKCCCCNNRGGCPCCQRGNSGDGNCSENSIGECPCCRNMKQSSGCKCCDCGCGRGRNCPFNKSRFRSGRPRNGMRGYRGRFNSRKNYEGGFKSRGKRNRMFHRIVLLFALVAFATSGIVKRDASPAKRVVGVKGTLLCGKEPAKDVKVKLFRIPHPPKEKKEDLTQVLDEGTSGPSGMFHLEGNTNGFALNETTIEGTLSIYHSCDEDAAKAAKNGYRRVNINIPEEYVNLGAKAKKPFDIGTLNLQVIYSGEKTIKLAAPEEKKN